MKAKARARTRRGEGEKEREAGEREKRREPEPEKERFGGQCCVCMIAFRPVSRISFECARVCVQYLNRVVDWTGKFVLYSLKHQGFGESRKTAHTHKPPAISLTQPALCNSKQI